MWSPTRSAFVFALLNNAPTVTKALANVATIQLCAVIGVDDYRFDNMPILLHGALTVIALAAFEALVRRR